ncbi:DUF2732 family protein [Enterobacteriaceae bacterium 89]|nr:DUF2732 family protein [Enterobacteriaceae bacterium 89]
MASTRRASLCLKTGDRMFINQQFSDEQLAYLLTETRNAERGRLTHSFCLRLQALGEHIHQYQLNGPEAAELLQWEEEKLRNETEETH